MKKLFFLLLLLSSLAAMGQKYPAWFTTYGVRYPRGFFPISLHIPQINIADTANRDNSNAKDSAELAIINDGLTRDLWVKPIGGGWHKQSSGGGTGGTFTEHDSIALSRLGSYYNKTATDSLIALNQFWSDNTTSLSPVNGRNITTSQIVQGNEVVAQTNLRAGTSNGMFFSPTYNRLALFGASVSEIVAMDAGFVNKYAGIQFANGANGFVGLSANNIVKFKLNNATGFAQYFDGNESHAGWILTLMADSNARWQPPAAAQSVDLSNYYTKGESNTNFSPANHTHNYSSITGTPTLATVATSGSYTDLTNKPDLSSLHTHANKTILDNITAAYTTAEQTKLAGIATGATANSSDATLLARANHTGTQAASTITEDATHRFATDAEKTTWNGKQDALGFTPYNATNPGGFISRSGISATGSLSYNSTTGVFSYTQPDYSTTFATKITYVTVSTYAAMIALGTPAVTTRYKVSADENKGINNTIYEWWSDGTRMWIAANQDN